jgi:plastocyanin
MKTLLTAALLGVTVLALAACTGNGQTITSTPTPTVTPTPTPTVTPTPTPTPCPTNVDVVGRDLSSSGLYTFDPEDITVCAGDTVTFKITSETEFHTFTVEALDIEVDVWAGETVELTFTFDKAGTYELICRPHQSVGMTGTITVRQRP